MSSWLKPRRGKRSSAINKLKDSNKLVNGEIFLEMPDTGTGTGQGRIKVGDGLTNYEELPYFLNLDGYLKLDTKFTKSTTYDDKTISECISGLKGSIDLKDARSAAVKAIELLNNQSYVSEIESSDQGITYKINGSTSLVVPGFANNVVESLDFGTYDDNTSDLVIKGKRYNGSTFQTAVPKFNDSSGLPAGMVPRPEHTDSDYILAADGSWVNINNIFNSKISIYTDSINYDSSQNYIIGFDNTVFGFVFLEIHKRKTSNNDTSDTKQVYYIGRIEEDKTYNFYRIGGYSKIYITENGNGQLHLFADENGYYNYSFICIK